MKILTSIFLFSLKWSLCLFFLGACSTDADNKMAGEHEVEQKQPIEEETPVEEIGLKNVNPSTYIGANISPLLDNEKYMAIHRKEFNANQALFYAGFGGWPEPESINLKNFNAIINWMHDNNVSPHVHMLVGPNFYMPDWLKNSNWSNEELDMHLKNLIYGILDANNNAAKVDVWNIANELFEQDGTYLSQENMLWNQLGFEEDASGLTGEDKINDQHPIFIRKAFTYAREKTDKLLEYRDYLIESSNPDNGWDKKQLAVYQLLKHMLNSKIPIDAVGIQGHNDVGNVDWLAEEKGVKEAVAKFKALGLEVYITELDVGAKDQIWTEALAEQQKVDYYMYIKEALDGGADRIYTWGIQDGLDTGWRTEERPLPWDEKLEKNLHTMELRKRWKTLKHNNHLIVSSLGMLTTNGIDFFRYHPES